MLNNAIPGLLYIRPMLPPLLVVMIMTKEGEFCYMKMMNQSMYLQKTNSRKRKKEQTVQRILNDFYHSITSLCREQDTLEQYFNRHNNSNSISDELTLPRVRDSLNRMDKVNIGNRPNSKYEYKVNDTDMSAKFYDYKQKAKSILSNQKYFQESHLHEML